ncbi:MarR family transcriptional regulator [Paenibacillus hamazuiensis]|uniref:MarR family transcriptional regulator n=1 Tax=Paenibacillus hamazuiensis TaxID=2936508 RepID=UPI0020101C52|nr:MarR family transcriptional regulator [Paenibacillus hamazuiensis]
MSDSMPDIYELRAEVQRFIRLFGLLEPSVTPCGYALSVSQVLAMQELEQRRLTLSELAQALFLERSTVSRLVDALVREDFVSRKINESNRREVYLSLTEKGRRSILRVKEQSAHYYESLLEGMSAEERITILGGFRLFADCIARKKGGNT